MVLIYTRLHFYVLSFNNHCHLLLFAKYYNTYHSIDCCKVHNKIKTAEVTSDLSAAMFFGRIDLYSVH